MKKILWIGTVLAGMTVYADEVAVEAEPTPPKRWTGALIANAVANRGNSASDVAGVSAEAVFRNDATRFSIGGNYAYGRQKDATTGEQAASVNNWSVKAQEDYFLSKAFYLYANARYDQDRIADLKMRQTYGLGAGYQWIDKPDLGVKTETGLTYYNEQMFGGDHRDVIALRLAYGITKSIGSSVELFHNVEYLPDVTDWATALINADIGGRVTFLPHWLVELKAEWRYNARPLLHDSKRADTRTTASIGYTF